jgi:hypothetical protein
MNGYTIYRPHMTFRQALTGGVSRRTLMMYAQLHI